MKITGARIALGAVNTVHRDFVVRNGRVAFSWAVQDDEPIIDLRGYLILPGLINAHDHLELNLFPPLGAGPYRNATEWARDVYRPSASPVKEHRALGKEIRLFWGGLKNLLSGVTTVAHHNPYHVAFDRPEFPVKVVRQFGWAHSLDFSPDVRERYLDTPSHWPFFIHAAEGTDSHACAEVCKLNRLGVLSGRTVLIHAIGLDRPDIRLLRAQRTSLAWCPSSNLALYGETLPPSTLNSGLPIALGTDSGMTAQTDLCDEISIARDACRLEPAKVWDMVTSQAARVLRLANGEGSIRDGGVADLIAVPDRGYTPAASLESLRVEMVIVAGNLKLASERLADRMRNAPALPHTIGLERRGRWLTSVDVPSLLAPTVRMLGAGFKLAGKEVTEGVV